MTSPPTWKRSWTKSRPASSTGSSCCAISGRIFPPRWARPRISRSPRSSTSWTRVLGPHIFPHGDDGADPRKCPACDNGRLNLKLGRFGAFVGCSNYPECKFTRQIGAKPGEGDAGPRRAGPVPRHGPDKSRCAPAALGLMCSWAKAKSPSAAALPKGTDHGRCRSGAGGQAAVAAARSGRCIPKTAR